MENLGERVDMLTTTHLVRAVLTRSSCFRWISRRSCHSWRSNPACSVLI